jgi:iron complex outermembrane receptor protein
MPDTGMQNGEKRLSHNNHNIISYRYGYFVLSALLLLSHSMLVRAQDNQADEKLRVLIDEGKTIDAIGEVSLATTSSAYSVVEPDRLRNGFSSLPEVLEQEVGVQIRPTGGEGSLSTIVLRGASNEQVIIYLDGLPLNDASGGPVDLSFIPVNSIERIEIYRGSTPLELGAPSIGGAVNIITRKQAGAKKNQLSTGVGSFETYKFSGTSSLSFEKDDILLNASYLQSENNFSFINDNGTQFNSLDDRIEDRNNDAVKHLSILGSWKHQFDKDYDTEVRFSLLDRDKKIPSVTNSADTRTTLDTQRYDVLAQMNVRQIHNKNINLNLKLFVSRKDEVFDDTLAQIGFFNQHTESITDKAGTQLFLEINQQKTQWKLLTSFSRETYFTDSIQSLTDSGENIRNHLEVSAENISYFNQQHLMVNIVLRYQVINDEVASMTDVFGVGAPSFDNRYEFINPQLGVKYRFDKRTYVTANVGVYNRAPSFFELFGGEGLLLGNAELEQEMSFNSDIGVTYTWFEPYTWFHDTEIYAGIFYNRIEDLIVRIFNGQGIGVPENISDAVIQGFESSIKISPSKRQSINVNLSLIDSINKTDITSFNIKVLPGYYQQSFALRYVYSLAQWSYSIEADFKRNMFYDRSNLLKGDDVNLVNLAVRRKFKNSTIDFKINNVDDENIQYFRNRPTPGINLSLTYNHSF